MYEPTRDDKFSFGLWTITKKVGLDPFGKPTREPPPPVEVVRKLGEMGVWGINFHDDDLVPAEKAGDKEKIVKEFRAAVDDAGMVVSMVSCDLFSDPMFRDGAFTSADARVRGRAVQKAMRALDLGKEFDAPLFVMWGGREGTEVNATGKLLDAHAWWRDALDYLCAYSEEQGYGYRFALEPKPNEPRGDTFMPTAGAMLGFIATLEHSDMVGVNPEVAHEVMAGLNFPHVLAQVIDAGKLFHVDLNDQRFGRFDQDRRFASENPSTALFTVALLEEHYDGPLQFDSHALRTEDMAGVWDFVRGSMRSYLILREKAAAFASDPEVSEWRDAYYVRDGELEGLLSFSSDNARRLKEYEFDLDMLRGRGIGLERIDQIAFEHLTGVR